MKINVHAGHNADGKVACGAIGLIKESTEAREVKNEVIRQLKALGHTVYDCTVDNAKNVSANLNDIVAKCNAHTVDLDISIHFNSGRNDKKGDGDTSGVEVLIYKSGNTSQKYAKDVADEISKLGYRKRSDKTSPVSGIKIRPELYVLKHTKAPAMLIECCFVDDKDDIELYNYQTMASAIVKGITGKIVSESSEPPSSETLYKVQVGAYRKKENAEATVKKLKAAGFEAVIV